MDSRPLTPRERAVLEALLAVDIRNVEGLRLQAKEAVVVGTCGCGCPSVDFQRGHGNGMEIRANAGVRGSHDGLFRYTNDDPQHGEVLGGIEWVGDETTAPSELPEPSTLDIQVA